MSGVNGNPAMNGQTAPVRQEIPAPEWSEDMEFDPFSFQSDEPEFPQEMARRLQEAQGGAPQPNGNNPQTQSVEPSAPVLQAIPAQPSAADILVQQMLEHRNGQLSAQQQQQMAQARQAQMLEYARAYYTPENIEAFGEQQAAAMAQMMARQRLDIEESSLRRAVDIVRQQVPQIAQQTIAGQSTVSNFFTKYPKLAKPHLEPILQHVAAYLGNSPGWSQKTPESRMEETAKAAYAALEWQWEEQQTNGNMPQQRQNPYNGFSPPRPIGLNGGGNARHSARSAESGNEFEAMAEAIARYEAGED